MSKRLAVCQENRINPWLSYKSWHLHRFESTRTSSIRHRLAWKAWPESETRFLVQIVLIWIFKPTATAALNQNDRRLEHCDRCSGYSTDLSELRLCLASGSVFPIGQSLDEILDLKLFWAFLTTYFAMNCSPNPDGLLVENAQRISIGAACGRVIQHWTLGRQTVSSLINQTAEIGLLKSEQPNRFLRKAVGQFFTLIYQMKRSPVKVHKERRFWSFSVVSQSEIKLIAFIVHLSFDA